MGIFNPGSGKGSNPRARAQRLDMVIGLLGFFTLMAFIQTVVLEVRGQAAGRSALLLAALVGLLLLAARARRKIQL